MDTHWKRHDRVYRAIRDRNPAQAHKAVLDDLLYAEKLLRQHMQSAEFKEEEESRGKTKSTEPALAAVQAGLKSRNYRPITK
jgi:hypothetical protein